MPGVIAAINRVFAPKIKKYATMSVTVISYHDTILQMKFCKIKGLQKEFCTACEIFEICNIFPRQNQVIAAINLLHCIVL